MQGRENLVSKYRWYNFAVLVHDDSIDGVEMVSKLKVFTQRRWVLIAGVGQPRFNKLQ
jgi:hypothetical protein